MIIAIEEVLRIDGDKGEVLTEATRLMHVIYEVLVEKEGEEAANEQLHDVFRLAKMTAEEIRAETAETRRLQAEEELLGQDASLYMS